MARDNQASSIYLRLPPRGTLHAAALSAPLSFAWSVRGKLQRIASATLAELAQPIAQAQRVVLLLAASDVTLMRVPVPPLPPARLQAALPALVEDRVIGDVADCAIAAGPDIDGQRTIAVVDRGWLQSWVQAVRQQGARRVAALPMQLCLPLPPDHVAGALLPSPGPWELALRFSRDEGIGLPLAVEQEDQLLEAALELLATFTPGRAVQLSLPETQVEPFSAWAAAHPDSGLEVRTENWAAWVEGAAQVELDLVAGVAAREDARIDWRLWRWPALLATACVLLNVVALNWDWWRLRSEGVQLQEQMVALYRRTFPNDTVVLEPLAQMKQKAAAARRASGEMAPGDFMALSASLGEAWAEAGNDLRAIASIDFRDGMLNVKLKPGTQVSLDAMRGALAARRLEAKVSPADPQVWQVRSL